MNAYEARVFAVIEPLLRGLTTPSADAASHVAALEASASGGANSPGTGSEAAPFHCIGVLGAGIMGVPIAATLLQHGMAVRLFDASPEALAQGNATLHQLLAISAIHDDPNLPPEGAVSYAPLVVCDSEAELAECDLIVETIVENVFVKQQVLGRLEKLVRPAAVLATNTSTIPIGMLARGLSAPARLCGFHFFHPVLQRRLVEIVYGEQTAPATVVRLTSLARSIGKLPVLVRDGPGFLVNRVLLPYVLEALQLLSEGCAVTSIDHAAVQFGMPMGPLTLLDQIGLDTAVYGGRTMWEAFPDRIEPSPVLRAMVKAGRLGKKSGQGFYRYEPGASECQPDPTLPEFLARFRQPGAVLSGPQMQVRLLLPMLLEATRALEERVVSGPGDVDLGVILGLGFPCDRGGLLYWADQVGAAAILEQLALLPRLGPRFQPTDLLRSLAQKRRRFYD